MTTAIATAPRTVKLSYLQLLEEKAKRQAERSLGAFIRQAWPIVEPTTPFVPGWHLDAIAEHLEAVSAGVIRNLVITMPPRHMKSLAVSVFWPTWEWLTNPSRRWLFASYAQSLSMRDNLKARRLIDSPWFKARWGAVFTLTSDQNVKTRFENNHTGYRLATSVGGAVTGEGGDRIVCDDPHNVLEAESDAIRTSTLTWWDEVMSSRLNDPKTGVKVIVQQRCHEQDLAGHVLEQGTYEHLCLPAEYEGRKTVTGIGWSDPRTEDGELLWPERYGRAEIDALKVSLVSQYAIAGQLQQRPAPRTGGLFERPWFPLVDAHPAIVSRCRFWDMAGTDGGGDWTVGTLVGKGTDGLWYVLDVVRVQKTANEIDKLMRATATEDGPAVVIREEQEPGSSGKAVIASHVRLLAGFDYKGEPSTGEKTSRWRPFAAQAEAGNVRILRADWNKAWLDELALVPAGKHDDQADAVSGAFNHLALNAGPDMPAGLMDVGRSGRGTFGLRTVL